MQLVGGSHRQAGAAGADRVTHGDRAAVAIHARSVPVQLLPADQRHRRERFVHFDDLDLVQRHARLLEHLLDRPGRCHWELAGLRRDLGVADDAGDRCGAHLRRALLGGDEEHGCPIIHAGRVACRYRLRPPDGSDAPEPFGRGGRAWTLVASEGDVVRVALVRYRGHFAIEVAAVEGFAPELLAAHRPVVHLGPGDFTVGGHIVALVRHVAVFEGAPEAVEDHAIDQRLVAHAGAPARVLVVVGDVGHRFHAAREHELVFAGANELRGERDSAHAARADLVDQHRRSGIGQAALDQRLAAGKLSRARLQHLAEKYVLDAARFDVVPRHQGANHQRGQFVSRVIAQTAAKLAPWGARRVKDQGVGHRLPRRAVQRV